MDLRDAPPDEITATLADNVRTFAAGTPAADDVTVLALRRL
jgi:serine phosphatase RsbU (regulator of sigma subunit)